MKSVETHIVITVIALALVVMLSVAMAGYTLIHQSAVVSEAAARAEQALCENVNTARVQSNIGLRNVVRRLAIRTGNPDLAEKVGVAPVAPCAN